MAGKQELRTMSQVSVDDKGEYRLHGLRPGTFYLQASGRSIQMSFAQPGDQIRGPRPPSANASTFYPSTTDIAHSVPVEVAAGALLRGIDIHLRREGAYAVRGKFPQDERPEPFGGYFVQLLPREGDRNSRFGMRRTRDVFEIPGVPAGSYVIVGARTDLENRTYAYIPVDVTNEDVDLGTLTFSPGLDISGVIEMEGGKQRPPDLHVSLQSDGPTISGFPSAEVKPDGSFVLRDVAPAVYQLNLITLSGSYLKSIKLDDHVLQDRRIDLAQGGARLGVGLATDVALVEGSVKKADGEPAVRVRVTLVPVGDQCGSQDVPRYAFSNEKGEFKMNNVPPGEYKIFAWEEAQAGAAMDPEFRKPFEKRGVALKIPPNGHANADLTGISLAQMQQPKRNGRADTRPIQRRVIAVLTTVAVAAVAQSLNGVIDIHVHSDPDSVPRSIDAIDLARLAKSRGMRALVLKNHYEPTASLAYVVRKEVPDIEIFGGIDLNRTVGGINPAAVERVTMVKGGC